MCSLQILLVFDGIADELEYDRLKYQSNTTIEELLICVFLEFMVFVTQLIYCAWKSTCDMRLTCCACWYFTFWFLFNLKLQFWLKLIRAESSRWKWNFKSHFEVEIPKWQTHLTCQLQNVNMRWILNTCRMWIFD